MSEFIPGTVLPYRAELVSAFSGILPLIEAAGGLSLSQLCAITGLEGSTIQNWVKRGWVPKPQGKKYYAEHLPRILLISALRESIQIEQLVAAIEAVVCPMGRRVGELWEEPGAITEATLYNALCEAVRDLQPDEGNALIFCRLPCIARAVADGDERLCKVLERTLTAMTYWYLAGMLRRRAGEIIQELW